MEDRDVSSFENTSVIDDVCENLALQSCFSHMTATAGDIASDYIDFLGSDAEDFLKSTEEDCTDLEKIVSSDINISEPAVFTDDRLYKSTSARAVGFLNLVSNNKKHFQPQAEEEWLKIFSNVTDNPNINIDLIESMARYSFAMHYLEDAFAAGHNGTDRSILRQDYDNAYHDDMNHTGIILSNGSETWHSYGDGMLTKTSIFAVVDKIDSNKLLHLITKANELLNTKTRITSDSEIRNLVDDINTRSLKSRHFLSLPYANTSELFRPCFYLDSCDKLEILFVVDSDPVLNSCSIVDETSIVLYECHTSKSIVVEQAARAIEAFILHRAGAPDNLVEQRKNDVLEYFADEYFPLSTAVKISAGDPPPINKEPSLASYDEKPRCYYSAQCDRENFVDLKFRSWGISYDKRNIEQQDQYYSVESLSWMLRTPLSRYYGVSGGLKFEVIDNDEHFLDRIEGFIISPTPRSSLLRNFIGVYLRASLGVDDIWQGENNINGYASASIGVDAHFGSIVGFFEYEQSRHRLFKDDEYWDTDSVIVGVRGTAIDLIQ